MEIWKDVVGYEGLYEVSNMGNVRNKKTGKVLKSLPNNSGYLYLSLYKDHKEKKHRIHRLVAEAFIPNPDNKSCVDHIDTNKLNNKLNNLRWCTHKENCDNPISKPRMDTARREKIAPKACEANKKRVKCVTTGEVFDSAKDAADHYNLIKGAVSHAANPNDRRKYAGTLSNGTKLEWKYI